MVSHHVSLCGTLEKLRKKASIVTESLMLSESLFNEKTAEVIAFVYFLLTFVSNVNLKQSEPSTP